MKRIIALLLCICMLALCLTSCGDSGKTDLEGHSRDLLTLKMAVLVDEHTTKEGAAAMAKAFNQIYQQTFSTAVEFDFFTPEEYISAMADFEAADAEYKVALEEYEAAKTLYEKRKNGENKTDYEAKKTVYEEKLAAYEAACVLTGKYGYTVSALDKDNPASAEYPSVKTNQYDILVMTDKAMYQKSVENGWVASLNTLLSGTYSVLNTKVLNNIAAMMRVNDETYGIPARKVMGEYTYLKVNNEVLDFYNIPASQIKTIADGYSVFATMNTYGEGMGLDKWEAKYEESFAPILNPEEDFVYGNVKYMSLDGGFSLVGSVYDKDSVKTSGDASKQILQIGNLLENTNYARFMQMQFEAKKNGYYGT
ncbi:MAG: hypothetical protein MJ078_03810, partial [Clostridia bacterium]|nr:hypothetical protein [Clostridia bacterium]